MSFFKSFPALKEAQELTLLELLESSSPSTLKQRLAFSSSLDEETSFSSQAIYALFYFPLFSLLLVFFSLPSLFGQSDFICSCSPQPKQV